MKDENGARWSFSTGAVSVSGAGQNRPDGACSESLFIPQIEGVSLETPSDLRLCSGRYWV